MTCPLVVNGTTFNKLLSNYVQLSKQNSEKEPADKPKLLNIKATKLQNMRTKKQAGF